MYTVSVLFLLMSVVNARQVIEYNTVYNCALNSVNWLPIPETNCVIDNNTNTILIQNGSSFLLTINKTYDYNKSVSGMVLLNGTIDNNTELAFQYIIFTPSFTIVGIFRTLEAMYKIDSHLPYFVKIYNTSKNILINDSTDESLKPTIITINTTNTTFYAIMYISILNLTTINSNGYGNITINNYNVSCCFANTYEVMDGNPNSVTTYVGVILAGSGGGVVYYVVRRRTNVGVVGRK